MENKRFITITKGTRGWFAVMMWWNPEGFYEPWDTSAVSHANEHEAEIEARAWAEDENIKYESPSFIKED